jgi:hypothetical protein
MEEIGEAAVAHVVGDEELLLLLVEVGDERDEVGVVEAAEATHVFREVLTPDAVHVLEPLHHHRRAL